LWLSGREVWFAPAAIVYHRMHGFYGRSGAREIERVRRLELNALRTMIKNLEPATLDRALPAALQLAVRRATLDGAGAVAALQPEAIPPRSIEGTALAPLLASTLAGGAPARKTRACRPCAAAATLSWARCRRSWLARQREASHYAGAHRQVPRTRLTYRWEHA
jgi:hypothetical protein